MKLKPCLRENCPSLSYIPVKVDMECFTTGAHRDLGGKNFSRKKKLRLVVMKITLPSSRICVNRTKSHGFL